METENRSASSIKITLLLLQVNSQLYGGARSINLYINLYTSDYVVDYESALGNRRPGETASLRDVTCSMLLVR